MAREMSVAPRERINIVYKPATTGVAEEVELPLKLLVIGDFNQQLDETRLEDRKIINVNKTNIDDVIQASQLRLSFSVKNNLSELDEDLPVELMIKDMKDFSPENVVNQVPELKKLLELREALTMLKGPMGNIPTFRKLLQSMISNKNVRNNLSLELKLDTENQ